MAAPSDLEAPAMVPLAPGATIAEAVTGKDGKPVKEDVNKKKLDSIKHVVLDAMGTRDADNIILMERIQKRFDT